jgi:hypothetical protein
MSNFEAQHDKDETHLEELRRRHKELDKLIEERYNNYTIDDEVRRLKTMKLWLKDEIHRLETKLENE